MLLRALTLVAALTISFCSAGKSASLVYSKALQNAEGPLDVAPYKKVGDGHDKSRSPCPFLNACANHGILPYSGKNIRVEVFQRLLQKVGAPDKLVSFLIGQIQNVAQLASSKDTNHPTDAVHLSDFVPHGLIEHDLSMSRLDVVGGHKKGDQFSTPDLMDRMLGFIHKFETDNGNPATDPLSNVITVTGIGAWRNERRRMEITERKHTPDETLKPKLVAAGECFFLLDFMGKNGQISGKDARTFLLDETFPAGWTPPTDVTNMEMLKRVGECATAFQMGDQVLAYFDSPSSFMEAAKAVISGIRSWVGSFI